MKYFLSMLCLTALMGCSNGAPKTVAQLEAPDKIVYQTQGYYNAAVVAETAYSKLPRCGKPTSPPLCSDAAVARKIRAIDDAAWVAIKEAQVAVRTPGFGDGKITTFVTSARALTNAFTEITETLPKKE